MMTTIADGEDTWYERPSLDDLDSTVPEEWNKVDAVSDNDDYGCQDPDPEYTSEKPVLLCRRSAKAMPTEAADSKMKSKLRTFIGRYLKRKPTGKKEESLHSVDAPDTESLLKHEPDKRTPSMDDHHYAESFCEINDLLAWLAEVKVNGYPAGLERRGDITRKIVEVELIAEWRKYSLEHRPEHATEADRADIIAKVEQLEELLEDWASDCRASFLGRLAESSLLEQAAVCRRDNIEKMSC